MTKVDKNARFTSLRSEDLLFLLDNEPVSMLGDSTITSKNYSSKWKKFLKRTVKKGLVSEDGAPCEELRRAIAPIKNYDREIVLTNKFTSDRDIVPQAAFYSSGEGTTFIKLAYGSLWRQFDIEYMATEERREAVLIEEFELSSFQFAKKPFSHALSPDEADEALSFGRGADPDGYRRWAREKGIPLEDLTKVMRIYEEIDRIVVMGTKDIGNKEGLMITGSPSLGVFIKTIHKRGFYDFDMQSVSYDHLAKQSLWDYFSDF